MRNKFYNLVLLFFAATLLIGCQKKGQDPADLQKEVIAIHDEVMPKMDAIMKQQRKLKALTADSSKIITSDELILANNLIANLEMASDDMMNWMRNYDSQMEGMSEEEKIKYLNLQKHAIQQVKQDMLSAISAAEIYLAK